MKVKELHDILEKALADGIDPDLPIVLSVGLSNACIDYTAELDFAGTGYWTDDGYAWLDESIDRCDDKTNWLRAFTLIGLQEDGYVL